MVLVLVGGCATHQTPDSYTGGVQKNFLRSCEAESKDGISNAKQTCACSYSTIKKTIPFSRFKKLNSDLAENPGPLPAELLTIVSGCKANETAATSSTSKSTNTTKPGTTTTTR